MHVKLKRLPGASSSGVPLVSFNATAFESQGWRGNENAPVSREAAESYGAALNRLLHPAWPDPADPDLTLPRWNTRLAGDTVVCYWSAEATGDDLASSLAGLMDADPERVGAMYRSVWKGRPVRLDDPGAFYALTLTGTQGRAIVRDWFVTTVADLDRHLADHFRDLDVVRNTPSPKGGELPPGLPLRSLLRALAVRGDDRRLPRDLAARLFRAALTGGPFPQGILARVLDRARAEAGRREWADLERRDARAALVKAVLNRHLRLARGGDGQSRKEIQRDMDPTVTQPGYLLGRLLAVIERIQEEALPEVNASVVDRYFAGASMTPKAVFPRLERNALSHLKKIQSAKPKTYWFLKGQLTDVHTGFDPTEGGYPLRLDLEDQGLFVLGYHQMRHWLWMNKEERRLWREKYGIEDNEPATEMAGGESQS